MDDFYAAWVDRVMALQDLFQKRFATKCKDCDVAPVLHTAPNYFAPLGTLFVVFAQGPECGKRVKWTITEESLKLARSDTAFLKLLGEKWNEQNE